MRRGYHDAFEQLHQRHQFAVGMQEAEVAGAAVTLGQDVLQDQAQEFHAAHAARFDPFGLAVPVAERHLAILVGQDVFLPVE